MSFVLQSFSRFSVSYNQEVPRGYRYVSVDDEGATIALPGYFDALKPSLKIGDTILISGVDENRELVVTQLSPQVLTAPFIVVPGHPIIVLSDKGSVATTPFAQVFPLLGVLPTDLIAAQITDNKSNPARLVSAATNPDAYILVFDIAPGVTMDYNVIIIRNP